MVEKTSFNFHENDLNSLNGILGEREGGWRGWWSGSN